MDGYASAKRAVFDRQTDADLAVIGIDDPASREIAAWLRERPARVVTVSGGAAADIGLRDGVLGDAAGALAVMADAKALPGAHNAQDAAAAAAMALFLGVPRAAIAPGLAGFPGLPHRQQRVAEHRGVVFVNDSKATNADAVSHALGSYDRLVWVAGGLAKAGGIEPLAEYFPRIAHAVLIGRDAPVLAATLASHGVPHEIAGTLDRAVPAAEAAARRTGTPVVLLSPACASFDQFSGYDARGARFAELARGLACGSVG
jgi:UDP-N-acetylmuramoylalanine--D-glutamate ligase